MNEQEVHVKGHAVIPFREYIRLDMTRRDTWPVVKEYGREKKAEK